MQQQQPPKKKQKKLEETTMVFSLLKHRFHELWFYKHRLSLETFDYSLMFGSRLRRGMNTVLDDNKKPLGRVMFDSLRLGSKGVMLEHLQQNPPQNGNNRERRIAKDK